MIPNGTHKNVLLCMRMNFKTLITKSIITGFILGTIFFVIAPFGLGIYLIEIMKPVLTPGVSLIQLLGQTIVNPAYLFFSLFFNGLIYSILVLIILMTHSHINSR
jgi:hypothetical protein